MSVSVPLWSWLVPVALTATSILVPNEDKLAPKLDAIKDCAIVYVAAIGGSAAARVVATKIHPVKVPGPEPILDILDKLQEVLKGTPPPWLRKALAKGEERTYDFEEEA